MLAFQYGRRQNPTLRISTIHLAPQVDYLNRYLRLTVLLSESFPHYRVVLPQPPSRRRPSIMEAWLTAFVHGLVGP